MLLVAFLITVAVSVTAAPRPPDDSQTCSVNSEISLVGDGEPHQRYKYVQMTYPKNCADNVGCEIAATEVEGVSTAFSVSASVGGWFGAEFQVSKYAESGEVANCQGEPYDKICVLWRFAHTAYTVQKWSEGCAMKNIPDRTTDPYMIASPNANGRGSGYVCGKNEQCMSKGHYFWANFPGVVEGGPQEFPYSTKVEDINAKPMTQNEDFGTDAWGRGAGGFTDPDVILRPIRTGGPRQQPNTKLTPNGSRLKKVALSPQRAAIS
ncbi:hypothetical protein AJ79_04546 [Helicocarpus griseus UAMH5409]|uniref:Ecp2 effector protein domain-containing protein n=1 Tax=Helicocarpus griseus UAMH5409 TaxID=1447875 RepID=A0A2B7XU76_9EURO|nr:hypothetical protein AJ79_04546 [Helicocarpus griseus UAMH5409]